MESNRQLTVLREWADSEHGKKLYSDMARSVQESQSVEQLALTMVAMLGYSRLLPDYLDYGNEPISGIHLADFDTHFHSHAIGNRGKVMEHMVFAMIRVLFFFGDRYEELVKLLVTVLDLEPRILDTFDGFTDQYLKLRIEPCDHRTAFHQVTTEAKRVFSR